MKILPGTSRQVSVWIVQFRNLEAGQMFVRPGTLNASSGALLLCKVTHQTSEVNAICLTNAMTTSIPAEEEVIVIDG